MPFAAICVHLGNGKSLKPRRRRCLHASAPGDWNQALMELGETICTPKSPRCDRVPSRALVRGSQARPCRFHSRAAEKAGGVKQRIAAAVLLDPKRADAAGTRSGRARWRAVLAHVAIPCRGIHEKSGGGASRSFARGIELRSARARRIAACQAWRDVSQYHARSILWARRSVAGSPAFAPLGACRNRSRGRLQRHEKNRPRRIAAHQVTPILARHP